MSHSYRAVGWNRQKKVYDSILLSSVAAYLIAFVVFNLVLRPNATIETIIIRGFGSGALLLMHVILLIGPLCRLDSRFLPLLYNRRHMGVTMFVLGLVHGIFALVQFHTLGDLNPFISVLAGNDQFGSVASFPFQPFGLLALVILFLMAATSHDFWLANLSAPVWKALHMFVYVAYLALLTHVLLGVLQAERSVLLPIILGVGFLLVAGLHIVSAIGEKKTDVPLALDGEQYVAACRVEDIPENRAKVVNFAGERVAIFRYDGKISALSSVCQHQNGPLGEGCVIDGFVTCPWHGYQYDPQSGASPPPFEERVPTFNLKLQNGQVWLDPRPNAPGTHVTAVAIQDIGVREQT